MLGGIYMMNMVPKRFYLDSIFDDFLDENSLDSMKCDIYEKDGNYHIEADIPGFSKEEIKVESNDGYLTITASKNNVEDETDKNYIKHERVYKKVQRQFYIGDIDDTNIKAEFKDGILKLCIPKEEKEKNKKIIEID